MLLKTSMALMRAYRLRVGLQRPPQSDSGCWFDPGSVCAHFECQRLVDSQPIVNNQPSDHPLTSQPLCAGAVCHGPRLGFGWAPHPDTFVGEAEDGRVVDHDLQDFRVDCLDGKLLPVLSVL